MGAKRCVACRRDGPYTLAPDEPYLCAKCENAWYVWTNRIRDMRAHVDGKRARIFRTSAYLARLGVGRHTFRRMVYGP